MITPGLASGLALALGIGQLVGLERERRKGEGVQRQPAGLRTFALVGLAGGLAELAGPVGLALAGAFTVVAALVGYRYSRADDPGLTTEFAMVVVFLLGVLAMREPVLAAASGVLVAVLLATKSQLHGFVRKALTEQELHDGLLLAAAAAIVLPLLPDRVVDPWQVLNPRRLWMLALIVMSISGAGHVALRALGPRAGLLLTGLAGGFASSTATTAGLGTLARNNPELAMTCARAALFSNVSTIVQLAVVTGALEPRLLRHIAWPLAASGLAIAAYSALAIWRGRRESLPDAANLTGRAFNPRHALIFVAVVASVMLLSAAALDLLGSAALGATLALSGFADVHAAAASAAQLVRAGQASTELAALGIALALATNSISKMVVGFVSGGRRYGMQLVPGLAIMVAAFAGAAMWLASAVSS